MTHPGILRFIVALSDYTNSPNIVSGFRNIILFCYHGDSRHFLRGMFNYAIVNGTGIVLFAVQKFDL